MSIGNQERRQQKAMGTDSSEEERARLAAIIESSDDAILSKTLDGTITSWNPGAERLYGYSVEEAVGQHISMLAPPERTDEIPHILERLRRGERVDHFKTVRVSKDGRRLDISLTVSPVKDSRGNIMGASAIARDITEQKRAEAAAVEIREAERIRLSRDLHDGVLQDIALAIQLLEAKRLEAETEGSNARLGLEIDLLRQAVKGLREAVYDLRPHEEVPFIREAECMVHYSQQLTPEREIDLVVGDWFPSELPEKVATQMLGFIREALTNARRHSAARHVRLTLGATEDELWAEVSDDGQGFKPGSAGGGMGLSTMRERATLLDGELEIQSEADGGTRIRLRVARPFSLRL